MDHSPPQELSADPDNACNISVCRGCCTCGRHAELECGIQLLGCNNSAAADRGMSLTSELESDWCSIKSSCRAIGIDYTEETSESASMTRMVLNTFSASTLE